MQASLTLDFGKDLSFNRFMVQEFIPLGQRVKRFTVEALVDGTWQMIAEETTIGYKRILRIPETTARQVRFSVTDSRACPLISNLQLFLAPKVMEMPVISRDQEPFVTISAADPGTDIHFTTDGSELSASSARYDSPFVFNTKGEVGSF
jgi:alpha-L-fucosidase